MNRTIFVLLCLAFLASCSNEAEVIPEKGVFQLTCDAEKLDGDKLVGSNDILLSGGSARSSKKARSGKYSLRLNDKNSYGFNYILKNVKKGSIVELTVWKNADAKTGALVVTPFNNEGEYRSSGHIKEVQGKWGKMTLFYVVPENLDSLSVYAYNLGKEAVYFDDFEVKVYTNVSKPKSRADGRSLRIYLPKTAEDSLANFKRLALERGVITGDLKDYVLAYVEVNGEKAPVELRLKGDWTDHVMTDKVSFRIKMSDGYSFDGLRTFSIQNPETRSFIMEWFAHQLFEYEDILTTRYEMIPVYINGKNMGVYALEEHFDKQLLEARHRREGPIMKYDEDGVWQIHQHMMETNDYVGAPAFESAEISVFKKNRTKKSPTLLSQFTVGQSNMEKLRNGNANVGEYMDIESTAKYLALIELINGKHGLTWHNHRYYMNPVTQHLEPIAFDCFMEYNQLIRIHKMESLKDPKDVEHSVLRKLFENDELRERYIYYLEQFSQPGYLKTVYKKLEKDIGQMEDLLQQEYPNLQLDKGFFEFNRKRIREQLPELKKTKVKLDRPVAVYDKLPEGFIYTDIALKANLEKRNTDSSVVMSLRNYHSHPIEIIGYSTKLNKDLIIPVTPITLPAYQSGDVVVKTANFPKKPRRIHYKAANCGDKIFKCNPEEWTMAVVRPVIGKKTNVLVPDDKGIVRLRGKLAYSEDVVVPKDCKKFVLEAGTKINLSNGAAIISYAPLDAQGTSAEPIDIYSNDQSSSGVVVLSSEKSTVKYARFDHLGTMNKNNWVLTGAVTFYGAEVELDHCSFTNNHCEDALNTIRCHVDVKNCEVNTTLSDGFDADFCTGTVTASKFMNTGNDCIDFSGSTITISDCHISNSGDKGISGGEDSDLIVKDCTIDGAHIAVASKDKSTVTISNISILKANYAFSAYRKKPEYGPASLTVKSVKTNKAKQLKLLEKDSKLIYLGKTHVGTEKFDIDAMYAQFSK